MYVVAGHSVHTTSSGPVYPALHVHSALPFAILFAHVRHVDVFVAPVVTTYFPAVQLVHTAGPVVILYVPDTHTAHDATVDPVTQGIVDTHVSWCVVHRFAHPQQVSHAPSATHQTFMLAAYTSHPPHPRSMKMTWTHAGRYVP